VVGFYVHKSIAFIEVFLYFSRFFLSAQSLCQRGASNTVQFASVHMVFLLFFDFSSVLFGASLIPVLFSTQTHTFVRGCIFKTDKVFNTRGSIMFPAVASFRIEWVGSGIQESKCLALGFLSKANKKTSKYRMDRTVPLAARSEFKLSLEYNFTPLYEHCVSLCRHRCRFNLGFAFALFFI